MSVSSNENEEQEGFLAAKVLFLPMSFSFTCKAFTSEMMMAIFSESASKCLLNCFKIHFPFSVINFCTCTCMSSRINVLKLLRRFFFVAGGEFVEVVKKVMHITK